MDKGLNILETLGLLHAMGVEQVSVRHLLTNFTPKEEEVNESLPELPEPPKPPHKEEVVVSVFKTYEEAAKEAQKGQTTVFDQEAKGFINV